MDPISPTLLFLAALMVGAGLYLIQRSRFLVPLLRHRSPYLRTHPRVTRFLFYFLLTLGVLTAGMGCRILVGLLRA